MLASLSEDRDGVACSYPRESVNFTTILVLVGFSRRRYNRSSQRTTKSDVILGRDILTRADKGSNFWSESCFSQFSGLPGTHEPDQTLYIFQSSRPFVLYG